MQSAIRRNGTFCGGDYLKAQTASKSGDFAKLGKALVTIAVEEQSPLRFLAGADAIGTAEQVYKILEQQNKAYRELSSAMAIDNG